MFLGIDLGTHSVKALLLDAAGDVVGEAARRYPVLAPRPGWSETAPEAWWQGVVEAVREAAGAFSGQVSAVGLSGQMHGVVLTGRQGNALRPAILWADTRAADELRYFYGLTEHEQRELANPVTVGMAGPTLLWLKEHEPALYEAAAWALQPKDWLRARLTGAVATDPSDASGTLLYNVAEDRWALEIVAELGLRAALLPGVVPSASVAGTLLKGAALELGLPAGVPVAVGAADTAAAALGSGLLREGEAQLTVGSGAQLISVTRSVPGDLPRGVHLYRTAQDTSTEAGYYVMAAMQNAGLALEWVLDVLGFTWDAAYEAAAAVAPGCDGVIFLPYLTGERTPHLNPDATGSWHGIRRFHGQGHLMRSALEGVAFAIKDGLVALQEAGVDPERLLLAGGSARFPFWRQLLADVVQRELLLSPVTDASARGAALLAAQAVGEAVPASSEMAAVTQTGVWRGEYAAAYASFRDIYTRLYS
jgi:xylulokinase